MPNDRVAWLRQRRLNGVIIKHSTSPKGSDHRRRAPLHHKGSIVEDGADDAYACDCRDECEKPLYRGWWFFGGSFAIAEKVRYWLRKMADLVVRYEWVEDSVNIRIDDRR